MPKLQPKFQYNGTEFLNNLNKEQNPSKVLAIIREEFQQQQKHLRDLFKDRQVFEKLKKQIFDVAQEPSLLQNIKQIRLKIISNILQKSSKVITASTSTVKNPQIFITTKKHSVFTHSIFLPLEDSPFIKKLNKFQNQILGTLPASQHKYILRVQPDNFHLTLSQLTLDNQFKLEMAKNILQESQKDIRRILYNQPFYIKVQGLQGFDTKTIIQKARQKTQKLDFQKIILFASVIRNDQLDFVTDLLVNKFIDKNIIFDKDLNSLNLIRQKDGGLIVPEQYHFTLFRIKRHQIENEKNEVNTQQLVSKFQNFEIGETFINKINIQKKFSDLVQNEKQDPLESIVLMEKK